MLLPENNSSIYRVFRKNCVFSHFMQTLPRLHHETFKALNAMRVYSYSYWLVIFCTTNSCRGRGGKLSRILRKKQYLMNTLYLPIFPYLSLSLTFGKSIDLFSPGLLPNHYLLIDIFESCVLRFFKLCA